MTTETGDKERHSGIANQHGQGNQPESPEPPRGGGLLRSGMVVSSMTLLSRILGFVRDQVLAIFFGAGIVTDVFLVAWKIPNFLRKLFAEGAFAQGFIPVFTEYKEKHSREALLDLAAHVSGALSVVVLLVSTLGVMLAPLLVMLFAPGFTDNEEQFELATHMLRITFPYLFFVSLLAYSGSILNTFGRFAIPSLTPIILNICMIFAAIVLAPLFDKPVVALAWGVLLAGITQILFQLPFLSRLGLLPRPVLGLAGWRHCGVRKILKLMAPVLFGSSIAQINILLDTVIASFLAVGSLSWLYYSDRLMQFPLGVLGIALATVILPRLSATYTNRSESGFRDTLEWAIRMTLLAGLPAAIGLLVLASPLIATLFEYGEFAAGDTRMTSWSLMAYALGVPAFMLTKVLLPAFFSRQDTKTPVRIGIIALLSNMFYNLLLVLPMVMLDFIAPHTGLALASTMSAWQQTWMLYRKLKQNDIYTASTTLKHFALKLLPGLAVMALAVIGMLTIWTPGNDWSNMQFWQRGGTLLVIIAIAAIAYLVALWLAGVRPHELLASARHDDHT